MKNTWLRGYLAFVVMLLLAACGMPVTPAPEAEEQAVDALSTQGELGERGFTTPTGWWWLSNATVADITTKVNEGYRIFDLEVNSSSRFSAVLVKNTGVHAKGWWWLVGQTDTQVADFISANGARVIDREVYYVNGQKRNAVVMVPNGGKTWWYYSDMSFADIATRLQQNAPARLLDIDSYVVNGQERYSVVMIRNSGVDAKSWWYYAGVSTAQISQALITNQARITDLERLSNGSYAVIMEKSQGESWWWYVGQTESSVNALVNQNGARIIDIERYTDPVLGVRYNVVMLNNLNVQSRRMANFLASKQTGGSYGHYVKQVNGNTLAALQETFVFEPASTIKALHHVHAMRQVALGQIALTTDVNWFTQSFGQPQLKDGCPLDGGLAVADLQVGLRAMMEQSDNRWTQAMRVRFGEANLNATAQSLGMTKTLLRHRLGCAGGSDGAIAEPNRLTLVDIGKLYEAVANGFLLTSANRNNFYRLMADGLDDDLNTIIDQEAAALGKSASVVASFKSQVRTAAKAGGYGLNGKTYTSIGGWIKLPFKSGGTITPREYVFGVFFHNATSVTGNVWMHRAELLREQIRAALRTF